MPLTKKGRKIKNAMLESYCLVPVPLKNSSGKEKGERVFYASQNKGTVKGTHRKRKRRKEY